MGDVGGIGKAGRREDFSAEELDRMQTNESTSHAMSGIRKDAHYADLDGDVVIRGDDKKFAEQAAEFLSHIGGYDKVSMGVGAATMTVDMLETAGIELGKHVGFLSLLAVPLQ